MSEMIGSLQHLHQSALEFNCLLVKQVAPSCAPDCNKAYSVLMSTQLMHTENVAGACYVLLLIIALP